MDKGTALQIMPLLFSYQHNKILSSLIQTVQLYCTNGEYEQYPTNGKGGQDAFPVILGISAHWKGNVDFFLCIFIVAFSSSSGISVIYNQ